MNVIDDRHATVEILQGVTWVDTSGLTAVPSAVSVDGFFSGVDMERVARLVGCEPIVDGPGSLAFPGRSVLSSIALLIASLTLRHY